MRAVQLKLSRLHIKSEDARALVRVDLEAFKKEFPEAIVDEKETLVTHDNDGLVRCDITIQVDIDKAPYMAGWLNCVATSKQIEGNPLLRL